MNKATVKYKRLKIVCELTSFLLLFGPLMYYLINSLVFGSLETHQTFILFSGTFTCLILSALNVFLNVFNRSRIWVLLITACLVIPKVSTLIIVMGICTIVEELVVKPLHRHFTDKYIINKEIDRRG
jgi:hypothetical protein